MKTSLERFEKKVIKTDSCWLWTGCIIWTGYGQIWWNGRKQYAHRVSFLIHKGEIPKGLFLDHLCRVRNCVNPEHLEIVTAKENINRGLIKTRRLGGFCKYGHLLDETNSYVRLVSKKYATLMCRKCNSIKCKKFYHNSKKEFIN